MVTRIDVCLAAYQGERYLPEQLASLRVQDDRDFRVLMQDDGSRDGTPDLLRAACEADPRFSVTAQSGQHLGAVGNFLSLIRQSDGAYTALCDQDDVWMPDRLSACRAEMARLEAAYGADTPLLVHSDARLVDGAGRELHASFFAHQGWDPRATELRRLLVQNNVTGCTLMMNAALRRLVAEHGQAEAMFMHDWFIALTAAAFGHIGFVHRPLVSYRQHGSNVQGASGQSQLGRAAKALALRDKARARIELTYRHTEAFRDAYADHLPPEARRVIDGYLRTRSLAWPHRAFAIQQQGYTMQSWITRAGQILFS